MEKVIGQFDSAVGISLDRGWTVRVSNPGKGERFFLSLICPHRLWGPPRLTFSGYRRSLFSVKAAGAWIEPLPPYSAEAKNEWSYDSSPLHAIMAWIGTVYLWQLFFLNFSGYSIPSVFTALFFYACIDRDRLTDIIILVDALRNREGD